MDYLKFDKGQLINLEYSLTREILRSNRAGSYICTTLNGCNTRKYHGLLVTPIEEFNGEKHVLLSSLDATIIQQGSEFNLGIHRYEGGIFEPKGHKYIRNLEFGLIPKITYRIGGVVLSVERVLVEKEQQVLIKYTLEEATSPTKLKLKPFLAFRNIHRLSKANLFLNAKYHIAKNGIKIKLYEGYPFLHMQLNKDSEFVPVPDWYYNIEYIKEKNRGYDYLEDLFVPGYFEMPIEKGESIVFAASTTEINPIALKQRFTKEINKRVNRITFWDSLKNASEQFVMFKKSGTDIIAGFPWYGSITRQTFISLPGLCLALGEIDICKSVLISYSRFLKNGLFPKNIDSFPYNYDAVDSPLWFFWTVQQYYKRKGSGELIWKYFGKIMESILEAYIYGLPYNIRMHENGLIYAGDDEVALTWMDSYFNGKPVVQRNGYAVEVNALWYNALCFSLELAKKSNDQRFLEKWESYPGKIEKSFIDYFWDDVKGYLVDHVDNDHYDYSIRPNMIIATALEYSPLTSEMKKSVLSIAKKQLLTPRGLRTLSPEHSHYKGVIEGNQQERELAFHQGAVYPWLLMFFIEGYLKIHKSGGLSFVKKIVEDFEEEMTEHCIGTIPEMYNGNPPFIAKGAISQAWNVASLVYVYKLIQEFE